jgi:hypothetical protein
MHWLGSPVGLLKSWRTVRRRLRHAGFEGRQGAAEQLKAWRDPAHMRKPSPQKMLYWLTSAAHIEPERIAVGADRSKHSIMHLVGSPSPVGILFLSSLVKTLCH